MKQTRTLQRALSMLLTAAMVMNMGLTPVFAAEGTTPPGVSDVCTHHTEHKEDCGYQQGAPCNHEHSEDCTTQELICKLIAGDAPEIATDSETVVDSGNVSAGAPHAHGEDCYAITENCKHTHDDTCGYTPDSPCRFDVASCTQCDTGDKPVEKVCTCEPVDSGELVHGKDCPLYTTPALSEAVKALIAMVDALPNADTITDKNRETIKPAFDAAQTAYKALSGDDKAAFVTTKQYAKLSALQAMLYPVALMANSPITLDITGADKYINITATGYKEGTAVTETAHTGGYIITGTVTGTDAASNHVTVSGGIHNITLKNADIKLSDNDKCAFVVENNSTVNLTLEGANVLQSGGNRAGLEVNVGNTLTITSASTVSGGTVTATGGRNGAGIGGGRNGAGGTITISGGTVTAIGGYNGAGIGRGDNSAGGSITVSGGTVTANGGDNGAGIGGGGNGAGGTITISGGTVTATGGRNGAGIGGGYDGAGGSITISGGTVTASSGIWAAGIGGGGRGANNTGAPGETITISGGTVTANGSDWAAGIGGAWNAAGGNITINGNAVIFVTKGKNSTNYIGAGRPQTTGTVVTKTGGIIFEGNAGTVYGVSVTPIANFTVPADHTLTIGAGQTVDVQGITATNNGKIVNGGTINGTFKGTPPVSPDIIRLDISDADNYVVITQTGYSVGEAKELPHTGAYIITGTATATNATNSHVFVSKGKHHITFQDASIQLTEDGKYAFWAMGDASVNLTLEGTNVLQSGKDCAALGTMSSAALTIIGTSTSSLTATGGEKGAGIGGGQGYKCGNITIRGGTVTAIGGTDSAGIGGGGEGGNITIDGDAVVYASKGTGAPNHIGAGKGYSGGTLNKTRGIVFEGENGAVYGSVTLEQDLTITPTQTLTIGSGAVLTNNGTLMLAGALTGEGTLSGAGTFKTSLALGDTASIPDQVYTGAPITPEVIFNTRTIKDKVFTIDTTGYTKTYEDNINVGTAKVVFTKDSDNAVKVEQTFAITKSASALTLTTNKTDNTFTYGDAITFTANVSIPATKARAAAVNTVDFYYGTTKLGTANLTESGGRGSATFTYDTTGKVLNKTTSVITAKYGGSGNLSGQTATVTVTLKAKPLTGGTITPGQSKPYDGNNSFSGIAATFAPANGVLGSDNVTATVGGTTSSLEVGTSLPLTITSATLGAADAGFYLLPADLTTITGNSVAITKITPTITVETDKSSDLGGKEITVTVKITNPVGATSGFPEAGEITIVPTNATLKTALAQQGTTGVYTATYILGTYSAGAKAKFVATVPDETINYKANTTGATAEVEILDKYTPTITLTASKTEITYGESITLTATVGKNGETSPLAGTVQFKLDNASVGSPVAINADGVATLTVGKETLIVSENFHNFEAEFIPESSSDYKGKTSETVSVKVKQATMGGTVTIDGTPKYGEVLTANTSTLSGQEGDALGEFKYKWFNGMNQKLGAAETYTIQAADIDLAIYVSVTPGNSNYKIKTCIKTVKPTKAGSYITTTSTLTKTYDGLAVSNPVVRKTGSKGAVTFEWYSGAATGTPLGSAPTNVGFYSVKATLAADSTHEGATATTSFSIYPKAITPTVTVTGSYTYTGSQIQPTITVKVDGNIIADSNYTVSYGTNINAGTDAGSVAVTLKGNYSGRANATFTISKAAAPTVAPLANLPMVKGQQRAYTFDLSTLAMPQNAGTKTYAVANPSDDSLFTANPTVDADGKTLKFTSANIDTVGGTSTVAVTITSGNYADATVTLTFKITDKTPVAISGISVADRAYNGTAIAYTGTPIAKDGENAVTVSDYTYAWSTATGEKLSEAPKNAGSYKLTVSVKESDTQYIGSVDVPFTISKAALTIKADNQTILIGASKPTYTATPNGLVSGEAVTGVTFTDNALDTNTKGSFIITPTGGTISGGGNENYSITYEPGTLTINIDVSAIDTAIGLANTEKGKVIISDQPASSVENGKKFVTTAEMKALTDAIDTATAAKSIVNTADEAQTVAAALDSAVATFVEAIKTGTYTAPSGGGGGGGGGSTPTPPVTPEIPNPPTTVERNVNSKTDDKGNATATVADKDITNAIDKAQKEAKKNGTEANGIAITLNVKTDKNASTLGVTLPQKSVSALIAANVTQVTINNGLSTITLDLAALNALKGGDVVLTVSKMDVKTLSAEAQNAIGSRPVFRFGATVGGKAVTDFKAGRVGLQMPYIRNTTEQVGNLCAVYVDGNGKLTWLENSSYDPITSMMLASTSHFSIYGVGYKQSTPKFTDVGTHWAKNDIDFVVARGLLSGTSNTTFAPETSMTRGMFVTALGRLAGVDTKKFENTKFTDVKADAYYAPYVAWANANNIVNGTSDTTFSPDKAISRQEMAVMLVNYSMAIGYKLPSVHAEVTFTDASSIASWAKDAVGQMQMAGILMGKSGNRFDPTATATRAEVSAMLRRYVELVVSTETAEGWAMNESGQWMYIQDGKRITGKKNIDGTAYAFDQYGVTTALPPERKYGTHIVQRGESFWGIAWKYKVSMFELAKVNGKTIFSIIYTGDELKIPQQ